MKTAATLLIIFSFLILIHQNNTSAFEFFKLPSFFCKTSPELLKCQLQISSCHQMESILAVQNFHLERKLNTTVANSTSRILSEQIEKKEIQEKYNNLSDENKTKKRKSKKNRKNQKRKQTTTNEIGN
jgi:uncharacterized protein YlxW (UPF0749 family)